jgi:outer membrane cobalamin receptor
MKSSALAILALACLAAAPLRPDDLESGQDALDFFQAQDTVMTRTKAGLDRKDAPATTVVITADEIARFGWRTIGEALQSVPGLFTTYDRNYAYLGVRGVSQLNDYGTRALILVDGNSTSDAVFSSTSVGNELGVDISQVKRIEVVLGPGSTDYGSHAMFTVINVITQDGQDLRGGKVSAGYGSYNSRDGKFSLGDHLANGLDYYLSGALLASDGQDVYSPDSSVTQGINHGVYQDGDFEDARQALLKLAWDGWTLESAANWRRKGIPNGSSATTLNSLWDDGRNYSIDEGNFTELRWSGHREGLDTSARIYHRWYEYIGNFAAQDPNTLGTLQNVETGENDRVGGEAELTAQVFEGDHLTLGTELVNDDRIRQTSANTGDTLTALTMNLLDDNQALADLAFYAEDTWQPSPALTLLLAARYDHYSSFAATVSPRASLLWHFWQDHTLKLLYGTAFSEPNAYAEYYQDNGISTIANPALQPEHLQTLEAVLEHPYMHWLDVRTSVYRNDFTNQITLQTNGPFSQWQNVGSGTSQGVELAVSADKAGWKASLGGNWQQSLNNAYGVVANSPNGTASAKLSAPLARDGDWLSFEAVYVGRRMSGVGNWIEPYGLCNLTLFSASLLPHVELTLKCNNLFDAVYDDPSGEGGLDVLQQDRRNVYAKGTLVF